MAPSPSPAPDRDNLAAWLLQVCQQEEASPHVFCLAVNMMDRVLARVEVSTSQLPLLASSCLLVSWKIRQHKPISASSLVKYSQTAFLLEELLEWEVYVLSKLQWNPPTVVATDLLDDLLKRVSKHRPELSVERTKAGVESLLEQALLSYRMSSFSPAVTAAAAILLTIRQHFSSPSPSTTTSTPVSRTPFQVLESPINNVEGSQAKPSDLERVTKSIIKVSLVEKTVLMRCLETLETVLTPPPPSSSSPPPSAARSLFTDTQEKTPTKILEAATSITN